MDDLDDSFWSCAIESGCSGSMQQRQTDCRERVGSRRGMHGNPETRQRWCSGRGGRPDWRCNSRRNHIRRKCAVCHGDQGKGGVANPGAEEPTVPELNPIDACMKNADAKTYATNIDLFIEWGTQLEGATKNMPAFGQQAVLTQQQIADVIAYVISLNK